MISFKPDQFILVTGASSGIGRQVALYLNRLGASVIANGRDEGRLSSARAEACNPDNFHTEKYDLASNPDSLEGWVKSLKDKYGKLRGLAYCAGIVNVNPLKLYNTESIRRMFDINYIAPLMLAKGFVDRRVNAGEGSAAVFISSVAYNQAIKGQTIYAGSKSALISSIACLSKEVASRGVRVNCISPGFVRTEMTDKVLHEGHFEAIEHTDVGEPSDIANLAAFLLSDSAGWINGENYIINGSN